MFIQENKASIAILFFKYIDFYCFLFIRLLCMKIIMYKIAFYDNDLIKSQSIKIFN
jgi:hypothetical protein